MNKYCEICMRLKIFYLIKFNIFLILISVSSFVNSAEKNLVLVDAVINGDIKQVKALLESGSKPDVFNVDGITPLHMAVYNENSEIVKDLLKKGANPNLIGKGEIEGLSPLMLAVDVKSEEIISNLLGFGANPLLQSSDLNTPLHFVIRVENNQAAIAMINSLKEYKDMPLNEDGMSPFLLAIDNGNYEIVKVFLDKFGNEIINNTKSDYPPVLVMASASGNHELFELILNAGADINVFSKGIDGTGVPYFHYAVYGNNKSIIDNLLKVVVDIDIATEQGETALYALFYDYEAGYDDVILTLLNSNASLLKLTAEGTSPLGLLMELDDEELFNKVKSYFSEAEYSQLHDFDLLRAVENDEVKKVKALLGKGANPNFITNGGQSLLYVAIDQGSEDISRLLIDHGANVNLLKDSESPLVLLALEMEMADDFIVLLIEKGSDVNGVNEDGDSLLHLASKNGNAKLTELLIDKGVAPDASGNNKYTALHYAVISDDKEVFKMLLEAGANVNIKDEYSETPVTLSLNKDRMEFVHLLIKHGADLKVKDIEGFTLAQRVILSDDIEALSSLMDYKKELFADKANHSLIHFSLQHIKNKAVKQLVRSKALINGVDKDGNTPLHMASRLANIGVAKLLLDNGASVNATNKSGRSALHLAAKTGDEELLELLLDEEADPLIKDNKGYLAWQLAFQHGWQPLVKKLVSVLPVPDKRTNDSRLFEDQRIAYWSALYLSGQRDEALARIEEDLLSDNPHPYASRAWTGVHSFLENTEEAYNQSDEELKLALGITPVVEIIKESSGNEAVLKRFTPDMDYKTGDLFGLISLAYSADALDRVTDKYRFLSIATRLHPDFFQTAWMSESATELNQPEVSSIVSSLLKSAEMQKTLWSDYVSTPFTQHRLSSTDKQLAVKKWLVERPNDVRAWTALGYLLNGNERFDLSLDAHFKAFIFYPFYANYDNALEQLIKLDKYEQAERYAMQLAQVLKSQSSNETYESIGKRYFADALKETGDKGAARKVVEKALKQWPDSYKWKKLIGKIERNTDRNHQALEYIQSSISLNPDKKENQVLLIKLLRDTGQVTEALLQWNKAKEIIINKDADFYLLALNMLEQRKELDKLDVLLKEALTHTPESSKLLRKKASLLWQADNKSAALKIMRKEVIRLPGDSTTVDLYGEYLKQGNKTNTVDEEWSKLLQQYPWSEALWSWKAENLLSSDKAKLDNWAKAKVVNPGVVWPYYKTLDYYIDKKDWDSCFAEIKDFDQRTKELQVSQSDLMQRHRLKTLIISRVIKYRYLSGDVLSQAFKDLETYRDLFGDLTTYYSYLSDLKLATKDEAGAAQALYQWSRLDKDNRSLFHDLVKYGSELPRDHTFGYGYRMVERSPYDESVHNSFLHKHVLWGGSPVVALMYIEKMKLKGLPVPTSYEKRARGQLGDSVSRFKEYINNTSVGEGHRYIDWFHDARKKALSDSAQEIIYHFDKSKAELSIIQPDGQVLVRRDSQKLGKIEYLGQGATFIEALYSSDTGSLIALKASSGKTVHLNYNDANQITVMTGVNGETLTFKYNKLNKPIRIAIKDLGEIKVTYDQQGEINKISSDSGHKMALKVTQSFQDLLGLSTLFKRYSRTGKMPVISANDEHLEALEGEYQQALSIRADNLSVLQNTYVEYLVKHVRDHQDNYHNAREILDETLDEVIHLWSNGQADPTKEDMLTAARYAELWHQLIITVKPRGLPQDDFARWSKHKAWLHDMWLKSGKDKYKTALNTINQNKAKLLRDAQWLSRSRLSNSGYWNRYSNKEILSDKSIKAEKKAILVRKNGDVVVGTSQGIQVLRRGFWEWFGYSESDQRFSHNINRLGLNETSSVLALAETSDGVLWVGTENGLIAITGKYSGETKRWITKGQGLPSPRIEHLVARGKDILAGTTAGLVRGDINAFSVFDESLGHKSIQFISAGSSVNEVFLVGTADGLWGVSSDGKAILLESNKVKHAIYHSELKQVFILKGFDVFQLSWDGSHKVSSKPVYLSGKEDLIVSKEINGLALLEVPEKGIKPAVLSDLGINIYHDGHFQYMDLPFTELRNGIRQGAVNVSLNEEGDAWYLTQDGVYSFRQGQSRHIRLGRVLDMVNDGELDFTYIATGKEIYYVNADDNKPEPEHFSSVNAEHLALSKQGVLFANDYNKIVRFNQGESSVQEIFDATPSVDEEGWKEEGVRHIYVANDNSLWVASGSSLFHWHEGDEKPVEYNFILDSERFPSRSSKISYIYETVDGKLRVIASDEGHLDYNGLKLIGGELEWNGQKFIRTSKDEGWFVTAYTKVDEKNAIVSTSGAFYHDVSAKRNSFADINSYKTMQKQVPMLWLGGKGARLSGDDSAAWLFPSAGGIAVYNNGRWFYPNRLNQLLPDDQSLGQYGARTVHAVATDKQGRIYAGTDLGLLVYESEGLEAFLMSNERGGSLISDNENQHSNFLKNVFLDEIDLKSEQGKLLVRYKSLSKQMKSLEENIQGAGQNNKQDMGDSTQKGSVDKGIDKEAIKKKLKSKQRARQKLLARIEQEHLGLYQLMDPRAVDALKENLLAEDEILVQYLPTKKNLYINVTTNKESFIKTVNVTSDELYKRTVRAVSHMKRGVQHLKVRGISMKNKKEAGLDRKLMQQAWKENETLAKEDLAWLYNQLLRPIENSLDNSKHVFISPVKQLAYLPFAALIRQDGNETVYAVERFNLGVMPSSLHLQLVSDFSESYSDGVLFIADPDGSLPGARKEVELVSQMLVADGANLTGKDATKNNIREHLPDARLVHFATHGVLHKSNPSESYLLLANKKRLDVIDISQMDMGQTDLVILSACESGIGIDGMEYATLARAFAHAKVPSVLASYWKIHDAATQMLVVNFYKQMEEGGNVYSSLAMAQREMLKQKGSLSHPSAWASISAYGKP
ncbi:MAG: hypothetical protein DIZ80_03215 [endosymbiont of Galathealinum brachiosum]|uniref:CHAT domain-containing protein n=1 Tax=endosymbiont of Galathealinum brachiosum TaxID=2200906 RepID=A0A370DI26_9GAMM|nr:MAG: hypothetical protein DIZ80_03215 [endosymbiont of Galathealinum brachiosum]